MTSATAPRSTPPVGQPVRRHDVTQAFLPLLTESRGAIVNNVSLMALAPLPLTPSYARSRRRRRST